MAVDRVAARRVRGIARHIADASCCGWHPRRLVPDACASSASGKRQQEFDYVVVGGGTAGCVLAARLSEDPGVSVLLLEAGGTGETIQVRWPFNYSMLQGSAVDWGFHTEPQPQQFGAVHPWPRGKCLGGSSAINAMLYVRGDPKTYDAWAGLGCEGWSWREVQPFFQKVERCAFKCGEGRGTSGPLTVRRAEDILAAGGDCYVEVARRYVRACVEAGVVREGTEDYNSGPLVGAGGVSQVTIGPDGNRCDLARAYLRESGAIGRPNLAVWTCCHAERVAIEGGAAVGVHFRQGRTQAELRKAASSFVGARREVILSCGAVQSPQLLMLSGVGPPEHLAEHGVPVAVPSPGVGRRLLDHLFLPFMFAAKEQDVVVGDMQKFGTTVHALYTFFRRGAGPMASSGVTSMAFTRTGLREDPGDPHREEADMQLHMCSVIPNSSRAPIFEKQMGITGEHGEVFKDVDKLPRGILFLPTLLLPKSEGSIKLASADPLAEPSIRAGYLEDGYDRRALVHALRLCRTVAGAPALAELLSHEVVEPRIQHPVDSDEYLEEYVRRFARTCYHPMCSCRMGPDSDPLAVVDAECRVRGATRLRVVDASVMPSAMTGNTNAPTAMMAEKIAAAMRRSTA